MTLASSDRSVKRETFDLAMKEKERLQAEEKARLEQERAREEEEEVRKIRAQSNFKATPIKKYKMSLGVVPERKLTVPVSPKLQTLERAAFKDESAEQEEPEAE